MMELVLVNALGLTTLPPLTTPTDISQNAYLKVTAPPTVKANITVTATIDDTMKVDNMSVCTRLTFDIVGTIGTGTAQKSFVDKVIINGSSIYSTINNTPLILKGDTGSGLQGSTAEVISCGQTSTFVD